MTKMKSRDPDRMKALLKEFRFLIDDYGFELTERVDKFWSIKLVYLNSTTGIKLIYERKEQYVDIDICRLVDGEMIDNTTQALSEDEILKCINLNSIIKVTNPGDSIMPSYHYNESSGFFTPGGYSKYYRLIAEKLRKYSARFLSGDFSDFEELAIKVKKFYQKNLADYENSKI
jgi:hypothetical protein